MEMADKIVEGYRLNVCTNFISRDSWRFKDEEIVIFSDLCYNC